MVEPSDRDMMAAASKYRQEARAKEIKEAGSLDEKERDTDMSVSEALEQMSITFESDKFFADLATPIFACRLALEKGGGSGGYGGGGGTQADGRKKAAAELATIVDQIDGLKELNLFESEKAVLETIMVKLVDASATLSTILPGVRSTKSASKDGPRTEEEIAKIKALMAKRNKALPSADDVAKSIETEKKKQENQEPWTLKEVENQPEFTVTIKVPAETKKTDVKVKFQKESLRVSVAGHDRQPYIIDGDLFERVDPDACSWVLDGSGDGRKLVLDLEKKMGGFMWNRLMKPVDVFA